MTIAMQLPTPITVHRHRAGQPFALTTCEYCGKIAVNGRCPDLHHDCQDNCRWPHPVSPPKPSVSIRPGVAITPADAGNLAHLVWLAIATMPEHSPAMDSLRAVAERLDNCAAYDSRPVAPPADAGLTCKLCGHHFTPNCIADIGATREDLLDDRGFCLQCQAELADAGVMRC